MGDLLQFIEDEGICVNIIVVVLVGLKLVFCGDGIIIVGLVLQIFDGVVVVVVMNQEKVQELGLIWLVEIGVYGVVVGLDFIL